MKFISSFVFMVILALALFIPNSSWSQVQGIDGTWYMGEKEFTVEIYDGGWRFRVTNQAGKRLPEKPLMKLLFICHLRTSRAR